MRPIKAGVPARLLLCLSLISFIVLLPGCPPAQPVGGAAIPLPPPPSVQGVRYTVKAGDTLYSIAKAYGADWRDIVQANRGIDPANLPVGWVIIIPNVTEEAPLPSPALRGMPAFNSGRPGPIAAEKAFALPVKGEIIGRFGQKVSWRRGETNDGIDIRAAEGEAVLAAKSGRVNTFTRFPGYGKCVMLEHEDRSVTFYGYLGELLCKHGTWVRQGEVIGTVGRTGLSSGAELHFRIWQGSRFVDPARLLPG